MLVFPVPDTELQHRASPGYTLILKWLGQAAAPGVQLKSESSCSFKFITMAISSSEYGDHNELSSFGRIYRAFKL